MKSKIRHIAINNPCGEDWNAMISAGEGRFCDRCQKNVVDFTDLSSDEILKRLSSARSVCGRFSPMQLYDLNNQTIQNNRRVFSWSRLTALASIVGLFSFFKAEAKTSYTKAVQTSLPFKSSNQKVISDTTSLFKIEGKIIGKDDGLPIRGASVRIKGTNIGVITDINGHFKLRTSDPTCILVAAYIGYLTQEIQITSKINSPILISMPVASMLMGEVVVTPYKSKKP